MSEQSKEYGYIYTCYDPLIRDEILRHCEERFGKGNYFFDCDPGAAMNLVSPHEPGFTDFIFWKIGLAAKVHPYTVFLIINHSNCGAYTDAGMIFATPALEAEHHKNELERAVALIKTKLPPDVKIEHHYFLKQEQKFAW